ncbi:MAG: caspase family protein [Mesorhizobium sp.]|nr:MAG: caspase family protein [Mesorhizobium sp.]
MRSSGSEWPRRCGGQDCRCGPPRRDRPHRGARVWALVRATAGHCPQSCPQVVSQVRWGWHSILALWISAASALVFPAVCFGSTTVPRLALVIGNASYDGFDGVERAQNDAVDFGRLLRLRLGFDDVRIVLDAREKDLEVEVDNLVSRSSIWQRSRRTKPIVVVYFSGHGFTEGGRQFLAAVDAGADGQNPAINSYAVEGVIEKLRSHAIVVLLIDACRSELQWRDKERTMENIHFLAGSQTGIISSSKSLADSIVISNPERSMYNERAEFITAYANSNGQLVSQSVQGKDRNSPYTAALLKNFGRPGRSIARDFFRIHEDDGLMSINHIPVEENAMIGDIYLEFTPVILNNIEKLWESIDKSSDKEMFLEYIGQYRNGINIVEAMENLKKIGEGKR